MSSLVKELHSGQFKAFPRQHMQHKCFRRRPNDSRTFGCLAVFFFFLVDDGGDEEEANMRNGGERGESVVAL